MKFDIAIIGGGPGGYTAAEKAAKAGRSVVLFEKEDLGGTCLNRGCMPTKALLHRAETYAALGHAQDLGVQAQEIHYDFAAMHQRKDQVVATLRQGVEKLMKASKVTVVAGQACIQEAGLVTCQGETYEVGDIIIATGSQVSYPPIPGLRLPGVYNSRDILEGGGQNFASLVIVGGGVVGVECATLYRCLGCEVTVLEAADHILPFMDREIAQRLMDTFTGLKFKELAWFENPREKTLKNGKPRARRAKWLPDREVDLVYLYSDHYLDARDPTPAETDFFTVTRMDAWGVSTWFMCTPQAAEKLLAMDYDNLVVKETTIVG